MRLVKEWDTMEVLAELCDGRVTDSKERVQYGVRKVRRTRGRWLYSIRWVSEVEDRMPSEIWTQLS